MDTRSIVVGLLIASLVVGCDSSSDGPSADSGGSAGTDAATSPSDGGGAAEGGQTDGAAISWEGLGESCPMGCNMSVCVSDSDQCTTGWCAWDARYLADSYCTLPCVNGACPEGYECVENQLAAGGQYCLKQGPEAPTDIGQTCDATFYPSECYLGYCADRVGEQICQGGYCVKQSLVADPFCSMECNLSSVPCPEGYECRNSPAAGGSGRVCFKVIAPEDFIGAALCSKVWCQPGEDYCLDPSGADDCPTGGRCLGDQVKDESYCSAPCGPGAVTCPSGFTCVKAGTAPVSGEDLLYCVKE